MVHIVDRLREDHLRLGELFERTRQGTDGSADRRGNLSRALGRALSAHAAFKEMEPTSAEFTAAIGELETAVRSRVAREENKIFPLAQQVIARYEAEEMSARHDAMAQGDA